MQRFTEFDFGVSWVTGFFHQDWGHDGPTAAAVVAKNLDDVDDEYVLAVRRDAQTLHDGLPSETLEVLWDAGADYMPRFEPITGAQWTQTVVDLCDARLSAKADVRPLAGADVEDGAAQLDAIVAEIEAARFLEAKVRAALVDCARRCTPELAFRLFLRAMLVAHDRSLTPEQYARLETIGSALHYGEFVVDSVQYLVRAD
ncbi:contact-dependent growth inhibition system immunity protein [Streptomyces sp. NPDC093261]|uniref:contact-dependent growth inhibition system immunity protein n=1 Tax=Streptomyces sp. NPDC093261 TaxID=3366037 RepID=UPI0037F47D5A